MEPRQWPVYKPVTRSMTRSIAEMKPPVNHNASSHLEPDRRMATFLSPNIEASQDQTVQSEVPVSRRGSEMNERPASQLRNEDAGAHLFEGGTGEGLVGLRQTASELPRGVALGHSFAPHGNGTLVGAGSSYRPSEASQACLPNLGSASIRQGTAQELPFGTSGNQQSRFMQNTQNIPAESSFLGRTQTLQRPFQVPGWRTVSSSHVIPSAESDPGNHGAPSLPPAIVGDR